MNIEHTTNDRAVTLLKPNETWFQDSSDPDLWHHPNGLIVNGAALRERESYYTVLRVRPMASAGEQASLLFGH
jgi:hypothetical protein